MPVFFTLNPILAEAGYPYAARVWILLAIPAGPAWHSISEGICRLAPVDAWRARLLGRLGGLAESSPASGMQMSRRSIS